MVKIDSQKSIKYNKKEYKNLRALSIEVGIHYYTLKSRLESGKSVKEACSTAVRKNKEILVDGIKFNSLNAASNYFKQDCRHVCAKLKKGWSVEEALGLSKKVNKNFLVNGIWYNSLNDASKILKIGRKTVMYRLKSGWSVEEAFELAERKASVKCDGKLYVIKNNVNKKRYYGITTGSLRNRFSRHKLEAVEGSSKKLHKAMSKHGVENFYITLVKTTQCRIKLRNLEVKYINHYNTINKGYNTILGGGHLGDKFGTVVEYDNVVYPSISALAGYLDLKPMELNRKIKKGQFKGVKILKSPALVN